MAEITLRRVVTLKEEMEHAIQRIIRAFEEETYCAVTAVSISVRSTGQYRTVVDSLTAEVRMPEGPFAEMREDR